MGQIHGPDIGDPGGHCYSDALVARLADVGRPPETGERLKGLCVRGHLQDRFSEKSRGHAAVYPGGSHGLRNHTDRDLRILVVSVS